MSDKEKKGESEEMGFKEAIKKGVIEGKDEEEIEKKIEENMDQWADGLDKKIEDKVTRSVPKYAEQVFGIIAMVVMLIIVNLFWDSLDFITSDFADFLPLWNFAILVAILIQAVRIFYQKCWFRIVTDWINTIIFVYLAYVLWTEYPFDTSVMGNPGFWDMLIKIFILVPPILGVFGTSVATIKALMSGGDNCK